VPVADYETLASHYYDEARHPTCAALRAASKSMICELLDGVAIGRTVVELGAGKALAPECLAGWRSEKYRIILLDSSPTMLAHSERYRTDGAELRIGEAARTGLPDGTADLVLSSLGDPYNTAELWREIRRLLVPGGLAVFTTPSWEWSSRFRPGGQMAAPNSSEFMTPEGTAVAVPSFILDRRHQTALIGAAGLAVVTCTGRNRMEIPEAARAPKLAYISEDMPFAAGYLVQNPEAPGHQNDL